MAHHQGADGGKASSMEVKGKETHIQTWASPEDGRSLRLPDFKTIGMVRL